jgi:uncharacterized membrane protein YoaK (UPF0700 family)
MLLDPDTIRRVLVLLMALVAGCVDAIGFIKADIFPANMTGNAVLIATDLANASPLMHWWNPALVLLSFCGGCSFGSLVIHIVRITWISSINLVIFLAGLLVLLCGSSLAYAPNSFSMNHLLAISGAMGMQSTASLAMNVSGAGITVVITSTLTAAVSKITAMACSIFCKEKPVPSASPLFSLFVFGIYMTGAFLGGFHWGVSTATLILLSGLLLAGVSIAAEIILP